MSGKDFKAIASVIYPVGVTKNFEGFLEIPSFITCSDLA